MGGGPSCLSDDNKKLILADGACALVAPTGDYPIPVLDTYFNVCDAQSNRYLPCPTALDAGLRNCSECGFLNNKIQWNASNLSAGPHCMTDAEYKTADAWNTDQVTLGIFMQHQTTWSRIQDLCGGVKVKNDAGAEVALEEVLWPEFYHFYNMDIGKCQVDNFLAKYPETPVAAQTALKNNFADDVQAQFGLLNGYDWPNSKLTLNYQAGDGSAAFTTTADPLFILGFANIQMEWTSADGKQGSDVFEGLKAAYRRLPLQDTDFVSGYFGNPFWTDAEWQQAFRLALGVDCGGAGVANNSQLSTPADWFDVWAQNYINAGLAGGGGSADHYFDPKLHAGEQNPYSDPDYGGNLPYQIPFEYVGGNMIHRVTLDPTAHGYDNKCDSKDITEKYLPVLGGFVLGGVTAMIVPGEFAKVGAFGLGAYTGYEVISSVYGRTALWWQGTVYQNAGEKNAALAISVGFAPLCIAGLFELGLAPAQLSTGASKISVIAMVGAMGYYILYPGVSTILVDGGDFLEMLLAPVSVVTGVIHWMDDGCAGHQIHWNTVCKCEQSNAKPLMTDALLQDLNGVTEKQLELRTECMEAALTTGVWGTDPYFMGECSSNGWMSTPTACLSAGEWAYDKWPQELDALATPMKNQMLPCLDPENPSMLPPTEADKPCLKYGKYARMGGATLNRMGSEKTCYDYRAPGNTTDPTRPGPSMQLGLPTSYDWSKIGPVAPNQSECVIL
jgi:hypothetical protein